MSLKRSREIHFLERCIEEGMTSRAKNYKYFMECFSERAVYAIKCVGFLGKVATFNLFS